MASAPALADQISARAEQSLLNGDSFLNGAIFGGAWQTSFAAELTNALGVMNRPRPDYEAKGLPLGGFRLFPILQLSADRTDNVYAADASKLSDNLFGISPSLALRSQWGRHSLSLYGGSQSTLYSKLDKENTTDWDVGGAGRLDILNDSDLRANVYYDSLHEPRSSPNLPGFVAEPTQFSLFHSDVAVDHKPNRFGVTLGGALDKYDYRDTPIVGGGVLDNSGRNENVYTVFGRASYDFSPGYSAFVGASYEKRNFLEEFDIAGFHRDSTGYHFDVGTQFFISRFLQGQVFVGHLSQNLKAPLHSISTFDYGANINWYLSPLWTAHLGASRMIDDTTLAGASATNDQSIYAGVDYELMRNVLVQAQASYNDMKFVGIGRDDKITGAGPTLIWMFDHNFSFTAQYQYSHRSSNAANASFSENLVTVGAKLQL